MKHDDFRLQYELFERLASGKVISYAAMNFAGESVMVHFLRDSPDRNREMLVRLNRLPADALRSVLEKAELNGDPVVITDILPDFESLSAWIADQHAAAEKDLASAKDLTPSLPGEPTSAADEPTPEEPGAREAPGEFTRLFVLGEGSRLGEPVDPSIESDDAVFAEGEATEAPSAGQNSEEEEAVAGATEPLPGTGDQPSGASASPGEFTRLFVLGEPRSEAGGSPDERKPPAPAAAGDESGLASGPPEDSEPSGFPSGDEPAAQEMEEEPSSLTHPDSEAETPGEFTRLFSAGEITARDAKRGEEDDVEPEAAPEDTASDDLPPRRGDQEESVQEAMPPAMEPPLLEAEDAAETPVGSAEAPGEFTRLFSVSELDREAAAARGEGAGRQAASDGEAGATGAFAEAPSEETEEVGAAEDDRTGAVEEDRAGGTVESDVTDTDELAQPPTEAPGPGEFTRLFGSPDVPPARKKRRSAWPDEAPSGLESPGMGSDEYLNQLGATPPEPHDQGGASQAPVSDPATPSGLPTPPPPPFSTPSGPSEYTKIIQSDAPGVTPPPEPPLSTPPSAGPVPAGGAKAEKSERRWPYIAGLVAIVLLALGLILFFALRRGGEDTPPEGEILESEEVVTPREVEG